MVRSVVLILVGLSVALPIAAEDTASGWWEKTDVSAYLRYRHDLAEPPESPQRTQDRIRARVTATFTPERNLRIGFGLVTGPEHPALTYQALSDGFSAKPIRLDVAYVKWRHELLGALDAYAGKMPQPFFRPGPFELIWHNEIRPEGVALRHSWSRSDLRSFVNTGVFFMDERPTESNASMLMGQVGCHIGRDNATWRVTLGGSYYDYINTRGYTPLFDSTRGFGNSLANDGTYLHDYNLAEVFWEVTAYTRYGPVKLFGDFVFNTTVAEERTGWMLGVVAGRGRSASPWRFYYSYRVLRADAVIGLFSDTVFRGGGTDGRGHEIGLGYRIGHHLETQLLYFNNEQGADGGPVYRRLQLDLTATF
ncbi:hypothetical protein GF420_10150 [candidate division GN15 bacterium]|nr:hypothetical protein [candidate division GN15 bacterium]